MEVMYLLTQMKVKDEFLMELSIILKIKNTTDLKILKILMVI